MYQIAMKVECGHHVADFFIGFGSRLSDSLPHGLKQNLDFFRKTSDVFINVGKGSNIHLFIFQNQRYIIKTTILLSKLSKLIKQ
jgi:hypothetical protein